jgi:hypothetical protein
MLLHTVAAHAGTPSVDRRQARQVERIQRGVRSGELTLREARALRAGQLQVRRMEHRAKADGIVTARERVRLHRALDVQARRIHQLKHNRRDRI